MTVAWLEQMAAEMPGWDAWLTRAEQAHLGGLLFGKRRADWRLGRWTAKLAVSKALGLPHLESIEIRPAPTGAPRVFVAGEPAPISISISHRDGLATCAVASAGTWLGCDIETIEPRSDAFAAQYFTDAEQSAANNWTMTAVHWSAKESALKALGIGLGVDMRRLSVQLSAGEGWAPLTVRYEHLRTFRGWWRESGGLVRTIVAAPVPSAPVPAALFL